MNKKKARFFCENCKSEVKSNARFCNKCGKFFVSVRCPKCGKSGPQNIFVKGCPQCGYATTQRKTQKEHSFVFPKTEVSNDGLPYWIYVIVIGVLIGLIWFLLNSIN
ncbi:MAG: zinc ribbon domain-containing protein [Treponema sp.]|nr:zinc ribbon domain-containing protein [Treponema sp.]